MYHFSIECSLENMFKKNVTRKLLEKKWQWKQISNFALTAFENEFYHNLFPFENVVCVWLQISQELLIVEYILTTHIKFSVCYTLQQNIRANFFFHFRIIFHISVSIFACAVHRFLLTIYTHTHTHRQNDIKSFSCKLNGRSRVKYH